MWKKVITYIMFTYSLGGIYLNLNGQEFNVFYLESRYKENDREVLRSSSLYKKYYWIGESVLIPKRNGELDEKGITKWVKKTFPNSNSNAFLSIDIEGDLLKAIREGNEGEPDFENAKKIYLNAINIIKSLRPLVKIGLYGMPFRIYYEQQYKNDDKKLYPILRKCDFISPSLYMVFHDDERGESRNDKYLHFNLKRALIISKDLNKPVIPYVWPVIHPMNKRYGGSLISASAMTRYLNIIKTYQYDGMKANGVFWWEESSRSQYSTILNANRIRKESNGDNRKFGDYNIIIESTRNLRDKLP